MNSASTDSRGIRFVTDDAIGGNGSVGKSNEDILLGMTQEEGLSLIKVHNAFPDGEVIGEARVILVRHGGCGDEVYVRDCPECGRLLEAVGALEDYPCLDTMAAHDELEARLENAWHEYLSAGFEDRLPGNVREALQVFCDRTDATVCATTWKIFSESLRAVAEVEESASDDSVGIVNMAELAGQFDEAMHRHLASLPDKGAALAEWDACLKAVENEDREANAPAL